MTRTAFLSGRRLRQLWYLPTLAVAMGLMMLRILVMAKLLDLAGFAQFSAGLLVSTTFCMLGCIGLQSMLQRDMPILLARHRARAALVLMTQALLVACGCAALALLVPLAGPAAGLTPGLLALGVLHGLSQQLFLVVTVESRSLGEPLRYALQNLWRALAVVAAGCAAAWLTHSVAWVLLVEAVASLALSQATLFGISRRFHLPLALLLRLARRSWPRISWSTALVFLGISTVTFALVNIDRWGAAALLDESGFAHYAFAGVILLVAQSAQSMINAAVYPMLARRYGMDGSRRAHALCARVSIAMLALGAALAPPAYYLLVLVIERWYPAYVPALALLPLVLAAGLLRVSDFWSSFLMICGHERLLLALNALIVAGGCAVWAAVQLARRHPPEALDFAWLALLLAFCGHAASAAATQFVLRRGLVRSLKEA